MGALAKYSGHLLARTRLKHLLSNGFMVPDICPKDWHSQFPLSACLPINMLPLKATALIVPNRPWLVIRFDTFIIGRAQHVWAVSKSHS